MILKRYGTSVQSVALNFDSKALNEIGFRRDHATSIPADEFDSAWKKTGEHSFAPTADGDVQDATEQRMLDEIEAGIAELLGKLGENEALYVENEQGNDWPKTKHEQKTRVADGQNRLHFIARVEPALRIGIYRRG